MGNGPAALAIPAESALGRDPEWNARSVLMHGPNRVSTVIVSRLSAGPEIMSVLLCLLSAPASQVRDAHVAPPDEGAPPVVHAVERRLAQAGSPPRRSSPM